MHIGSLSEWIEKNMPRHESADILIKIQIKVLTKTMGFLEFL